MAEHDRKPATYADLEAVPPHLVSEICNPALPNKTDLYRRVGVRHLWKVGLRPLTLEAFENDGDRWLKIGDWTSGEIVCAPPFDAISFSLADLWPLDPPLGFNEDPTPYYAGDR